MKKNIGIKGIPAVLWGETSKNLFLVVHGNMSHKEDTIIKLFAQDAVKKGYQVLSFDLPEHGERKGEETLCKVQNCVRELADIMEYARARWQEISLFACSIGAYFSLAAYQNEPLNQVLFLSPVVDMERIIRNMMIWFQITPQKLQQEEVIETPIGQTLYWDYYCYVKEHPIQVWNIDTKILYGGKDELCERDTIDSFVKRFDSGLTIMEEGEHFFHTEEQLDVFRQWVVDALTD